MNTQAWLLLLEGAWTTLWLCGIAIGIGVVLGLVIALIRLAKVPFVEQLLVLYISLARATPLVTLVLFLFLRSGRLMLITGVMLPAVLAATCLVLFALGMSFNMMTLCGMAAAVGLVVDDAVVMLEHIMRRLQERAARGVTKEGRSG